MLDIRHLNLMTKELSLVLYFFFNPIGEHRLIQSKNKNAGTIFFRYNSCACLFWLTGPKEVD